MWRAAIMRAVCRLVTDEAPQDSKPEQRLERLADALVAQGLGGDVSALREIGDRLDGKAIQAIEQTSEVTHLYVARVPMPSKTGDEWQRDHASNLDRQTLQ